MEIIERELRDTGEAKAVDTTEVKGREYHGITIEELETKWKETVRELEEQGFRVTNLKNALEGALSIRYSNNTSSSLNCTSPSNGVSGCIDHSVKSES